METNCKNSSILIKLNGEPKVIPQNISILNLLENYKIKSDRVVIELNRKILKKEGFPQTFLKSNDEVEIVTFVGGG